MLDFWTAGQIVLILAILHLYVKKKYSYWTDRGINGPIPLFPFGYHFHKAQTAPDIFAMDLSAKYGKIYGLYTGLRPTLTINDHELTKQVLSNESNTFKYIPTQNPFHQIWNQTLFCTEQQNWTRVQKIIEPLFSPQNLHLINPLLHKLLDRLEAQFDMIISNKGGFVNSRKIMNNFTLDVIMSAAFSNKIGSSENFLENKKTRNTFIQHALRLFKFNPVKVATENCLPNSLIKMLNFTPFFYGKSFRYFVELIQKNLQSDKTILSDCETGQPELTQMIMDLFETDFEENESSDTPRPSDHELIAQSILTFIASFKVTVSTLTHLIFELAHIQKIQNHLYAEIDIRFPRKVSSNQASEKLQNFPFLDAVINETLRLYPPVIRLERQVQDQNVQLANIPITKGVLIEIPTIALHRNPEYYTDPDRFNPDRFMSTENYPPPYTFLPFGVSSQSQCIGARIVKQKIKLCLVRMLQKFAFEVTSQTPQKLTFQKGGSTLKCLPFEIKVCKR